MMNKRSDNRKTRRRKQPAGIRTGLTADAIHRSFLDNLVCLQGRFPAVASPNDYYMALAYTVRDRLLRRWIETAATYRDKRSRTVCYLSAEYLLGPHLGNALINLGIYNTVAKAVKRCGLRLEDLLDCEEEPGLGNGGLGRLAACYMDSLATLEIPAIGYGIRYEFGIFDQEIRDGWQVEVADKWLKLGNPWAIARPESAVRVRFGGHTETRRNESGGMKTEWIPDHVVNGIPCDTPILGYRVNTANLLRLWRAEACESFDFRSFNTGDYYGAVIQKMQSENITKVLYPNDERTEGKRLRLEQQYFFVSCSLQDMIRIHMQTARNLTGFNRKFAVQLNDTHPAIAVAELMRLLVDEHGMDWDRAWTVTRRTFCYTNHTLLPEALERWPVPLFGNVLPRLLEIVYEINHRFLNEIRLSGHDDDFVRRVSIIDEDGDKSVRMANLACVGSHAVNGVSKLHTGLLKTRLLADFHALYPGHFSNKTNGVTPRRFIALCNPGLTELITRRIGGSWIRDLSGLCKLERAADSASFVRRWRTVKRANKIDLAAAILKSTGITVDPDSMFDVHAKRIHEYKRQQLNALHIVTLYNRLRSHPEPATAPRTFVFGGKAAPGYWMAKLIIKLINSIADIVNNDPAIDARLKVVFFPDFNVRNAQKIYPAADLSEQISTAGMEASGTGNMKMALNGALTIGTPDGANIEIRDAVGPQNFFMFGMDAAAIAERKASGYNPRAIYESNRELKAAIDMIDAGFFSPGDRNLFRPLTHALLSEDRHMTLADYASYVECQETAGAAYLEPDKWTRMSILNTARMGRFSSDRAITEYCRDIWKVKPVRVTS